MRPVQTQSLSVVDLAAVAGANDGDHQRAVEHVVSRRPRELLDLAGCGSGELDAVAHEVRRSPAYMMRPSTSESWLRNSRVEICVVTVSTGNNFAMPSRGDAHVGKYVTRDATWAFSYYA